MEFKDKLKKLRTERGVTQLELANAIFVSRSAVAKWENGMGIPSEESMRGLVEYFGVSNDYFVMEQPEEIIVEKNKTIGRLKITLYVGAICALCIIIFVAIMNSITPTVTSSDTEELYLLPFNTVSEMNDVFFWAEDNDRNFDTYIESRGKFSTITEPVEMLTFRDTIRDWYIPEIESQYGFEDLYLQFFYYSKYFDDAYLMYSYPDADNYGSALFKVFEGTMEEDWEKGQVLADSWNIGEYTVRLFEIDEPVFELHGYCQVGEQCIYIKLKWQDLQKVKETLKFVPLEEYIAD